MSFYASAQQETTHSKNYTHNIKVLVTKSNKKLKGPAAKNRKPWQDKSTIRYKAVVTGERKRLVGPKAKNSRPSERTLTNDDWLIVVEPYKKGLKRGTAKKYKSYRKLL